MKVDINSRILKFIIQKNWQIFLQCIFGNWWGRCSKSKAKSH